VCCYNKIHFGTRSQNTVLVFGLGLIFHRKNHHNIHVTLQDFYYNCTAHASCVLLEETLANISSSNHKEQ